MAGVSSSLGRHRRIGLDTSVFIYHLEGSPAYAPITQVIFDELEQGVFEGLTSVLTLLELTVRPLQLERVDVAREYELLLASFPNLRLISVDQSVARRAAELRARFGVRTPDAIQVATCLAHGATAFITNDAQLRRINMLDVLQLDDFLGG